MLTVPQIEALRKANPQLCEMMKPLARASIAANRGWIIRER